MGEFRLEVIICIWPMAAIARRMPPGVPYRITFYSAAPATKTPGHVARCPGRRQEQIVRTRPTHGIGAPSFLWNLTSRRFSLSISIAHAFKSETVSGMALGRMRVSRLI